jgi:hypothetical protein
MQQIIININPSISEHIMFFLKNLPKNLVNIESNTEISLSTHISEKAFGILKDRVKDPVQWQREIREESDRDVYSDFK